MTRGRSDLGHGSPGAKVNLGMGMNWGIGDLMGIGDLGQV